MAIATPSVQVTEYGQDYAFSVTLGYDTTGFAVSAVLRAYNGGPTLATATTSNTTPASGVWLITFTAANLTQPPGSYVWEFSRTDAGHVGPLLEPSAFVIRASAGSAYPRLTNLSEYLAWVKAGTPSDSDAQALLLALADAEEFLQVLCNRRFTYAASLTEYYDGNGTQELLLQRTPVDPASVSIYLDYGGYGGSVAGSFASTTLLTAGVDYYVPVDLTYGDGLSHTGIVRRIGAVWPQSQFRPYMAIGFQPIPLAGCLKVSYAGGYTLIPMPIKRAVWDMTTLSRAAALNGRLIQSQSGEGYSRSFLGLEEDAKRLNSVRAVVSPYRRYAV